MPSKSLFSCTPNMWTHTYTYTHTHTHTLEADPYNRALKDVYIKQNNLKDFESKICFKKDII